jgi:hypothetical protein
MNQHTCPLPDAWYSVEGEYFKCWKCWKCHKTWILEEEEYGDPEWVPVFEDKKPKAEPHPEIRDTTPIDIGHLVATVVRRE